ncbi:MAG TPA: Hsp20/alpha crystallin family protein [Candidatus Dormibacteraeota bacterium]|nr:Hsp20/alpha crystallin family protein [Candidatus Dormibacteraeota bacterium]
MTRWDPWRDLFVVPREINQFLSDGASGEPTHDTAPAVYLPLDIRQTDKEFILEASVPGFGPEEIEVVSDQGTLTICGKRTVDNHGEGRYLRRERRQLPFFRQISLPVDVRESEIRANYENGVLRVRIPREEAPAPTRIKIELASSSSAPDAATEPAAPLTATSPA